MERIQEQRRRASKKTVDVDTYCGSHVKQKAFITSNARRMVAACSRRAGKSKGEAARLVRKALQRSGANVVYVTHTIATAEKIMWSAICDVLKIVYGKKAVDKETGAVYTNLSKKLFKLPNDSTIQLIGVPDIVSVDKLRGQFYDHVTIDECQSFQISVLETLIIDVVSPACIDYSGSIAMIGTPPPVHIGPFYDAFHNSGRFEGWERHSWNMEDNPFIEETSGMTYEQIYEDELKQRGLEEPDSSFKREILGQWVQGNDELVYAYKEDHCNWDGELSTKIKWRYTLGVDIGYRDDTAFVLLAYSPDSPDLHLVNDYSQSEMTFTDITDTIRHYVEKYNVTFVVIDSATGGTNLIEEINRRYKTFALPAKKHDKVGHISIFNDSLRKGIIKVSKDANIIGEWMRLTWRFNLVTGKRKEDPSVPNHLCDAMLYGFRHCYQYMYRPKLKPHQPGSPEYEEQRVKSLQKRLFSDKKRKDYGKRNTRFKR